MLDAYNVKKMVPRIVIGVIAINLSIYFCAAAIDITNIVGNGIASLLTSPFQLDKIAPDTGSNVVFGVLGALATLIGSAYAFLLVGGPAVLGIGLLFILTMLVLVVCIMVTVVLRQALLVLLTIISPVAIACWILPNTEQYFKKWLDLYVKTLMVYPIIAAIFAVCGIMATISFESTTIEETTNLAGSFGILTGLLLVFIPLFLIPFAFKLAGGLMSAVFKVASPALQTLSKGRSNLGRDGRRKNWGRIQQGNRYAGGSDANFRGGFNRKLQGASLISTGKAGTNPLKMAERSRAAATSIEIANFKRGMSENETFKNVIGVSDTLLEASLAGKRTDADAEAFLRNQGWSDERVKAGTASIRTARREMGDKSYQAASLVALAGTGSGLKGGIAEAIQYANAIGGNDRQLKEAMVFGSKESFAKAQRGDASSVSAGLIVKGIEQIEAAGGSDASVQAFHAEAMENVLKKPAGAIMGSRKESIDNVAPYLKGRLEKTQAALNVAKGGLDNGSVTQAQHDAAYETHMQSLAMAANYLDNAGNAAPEVTQVLAQNVLGVQSGVSRQVPVAQRNQYGQPVVDSNNQVVYSGTETREMTWKDQVEAHRTDPVFGRFRREYGSGAEAEAAGGKKPEQGAPGGGGGPGNPSGV